MLIKATDLIEFSKDDKERQLWGYNSLDCALTFEIREELQQYIDEDTQRIYDFERELQGPALEMMLRGILVDQHELSRAIADLSDDYTKLELLLQQFAQAAWGKGLNPNSPKQLKEFFYEHCKLPEQKIFDKGKMRVSTNRDCLERLELYFHVKPIIRTILGLRDVGKKLGVLKSGIDADSRMRTSYNVAGTETGRWSSSENAFGGGTNLQNITKKLRRIFVADEGMKFAYIDLQSAESLAVGALCWQATGHDTYWKAAINGYIHVEAAKMVWPDLGWKGDPDYDKDEVAKQPFHHHFSYLDMVKRAGHGTNYYGKAPSLAKRLGIEKSVVVNFRDRYFSAFPEIPLWHKFVAQQLAYTSAITTPCGRKRIFFGRHNDDTTLRKAIAYGPQSTIADILNEGMLQVWLAFRHKVHLLAQIHDAILIQYPEDLEAELLPAILDALVVRVPIKRESETRELVIGCDAEVGWNWAEQTEDNPDGITKYKGHDTRIRHSAPKVRLLDRGLY